MSETKAKLMGAIMVMSEAEAATVWKGIEEAHFYGLEEVEPTADEIAVLNAYEKGDPEYTPSITFDQLVAELGL